MCVCVCERERLGHSAVRQKLTEHCKSTIIENKNLGVPVVAQWLTNPTRNHGVASSIPGLAQWVGGPALL